MKVAFGQRIQSGPWGGGNRFAAALAEALKARGDDVVFDLKDGDIDLILITDPRARNPAVAFTPGAALRYLMGRNRDALVVHRINECDQRKGTRTMNARLRLANYCADHTVFIGSWLRALAVWRRLGESTVILNGADKRVFNSNGHKPWDGSQPLRLITHHWGGHLMKGFDVYRRLDEMAAAHKDKLEFTYMGNLPGGFQFSNARHLPAMEGEQIAEELRAHHVYLTASLNEPAGMHHIEGALSGLPLLYRDSGALPEYCDGYGESFSGPEDFAPAVERMIVNYEKWRRAMAAYVNTSERMCKDYLALFDGLMARRGEILAARRLWRNPMAVALNQFPW